MRAVLARIERVNPTLNAFVTLTPEQALRDARAAERAVMNKGARLGPLHGVPRACAAFETLRPWAHLRPPVE
jgi:aspartyl-tRNA(Asn)/glutamyl-tRNA(Gln) amidotransferase subunit A